MTFADRAKKFKNAIAIMEKRYGVLLDSETSIIMKDPLKKYSDIVLKEKEAAKKPVKKSKDASKILDSLDAGIDTASMIEE